ncbi:MAG: hypothetical protein AAGE93_19845 [Bacteroidota bacterium]
MKWLMLFCLTLLFFGCEEDGFRGLEVRDDSSVTLLNGTWKVIAYEDFEQSKLITKTEENSWGKDVIIAFDDTTDTRSISGQNTTNSVGCTFEYTEQRSIQTSSLFSTYVNQPEWGNRFGRVISESDLQFTINTTRLKVYNESEQLSARFEKEW